jgi:hypothetical protein
MCVTALFVVAAAHHLMLIKCHLDLAGFLNAMFPSQPLCASVRQQALFVPSCRLDQDLTGVQRLSHHALMRMMSIIGYCISQ